MSSKKTYLVCCDYGTGGIWFLVDALGSEQINNLRPDFFAFEDKPDWMSAEDKTEYIESAKRANHHWDIDNLDWLSKFE